MKMLKKEQITAITKCFLSLLLFTFGFSVYAEDNTGDNTETITTTSDFYGEVTHISPALEEIIAVGDVMSISYTIKQSNLDTNPPILSSLSVKIGCNDKTEWTLNNDPSNSVQYLEEQIVLSGGNAIDGNLIDNNSPTVIDLRITRISYTLNYSDGIMSLFYSDNNLYKDARINFKSISQDIVRDTCMSGMDTTPIILTEDLKMHIPYIKYNTVFGTQALSADFEYVFDNDNNRILFEIVDFDIISTTWP